MSQQLRILLVEDLAADADLMVRELKRAGLGCEVRRVETPGAYRRELEEFKPHVILSDFSMPQFDGMDALDIARRSYPNIPFIFVSGTLGEEYAVRALKNGAKDYIIKNNLLRLPAAVERAIQETDERNARQALVSQLRESEKRYREIFQNNPHPMWVYDIETLRFLAVNDRAITRYGFSQEEFLQMTIREILPERELQGLAERTATHRTKAGEVIQVSLAYEDIQLEGRAARIVVASQK